MKQTAICERCETIVPDDKIRVVCDSPDGTLGHWCTECYKDYTWVCSRCFEAYSDDVKCFFDKHYNYVCQNCYEEGTL